VPLLVRLAQQRLNVGAKRGILTTLAIQALAALFLRDRDCEFEYPQPFVVCRHGVSSVDAAFGRGHRCGRRFTGPIEPGDPVVLGFSQPGSLPVKTGFRAGAQNLCARVGRRRFSVPDHPTESIQSTLTTRHERRHAHDEFLLDGTGRLMKGTVY
jgi:hypothetical protein